MENNAQMVASQGEEIPGILLGNGEVGIGIGAGKNWCGELIGILSFSPVKEIQEPGTDIPKEDILPDFFQIQFQNPEAVDRLIEGLQHLKTGMLTRNRQ